MSKSLRFGIILLAGLCVVLVAVILVGLPLETGTAEPSEPTPAATAALTGDADLIETVLKALDSASGRWSNFDYQIDHIQVQDDGQAALIWLVAVEIESGKPLGREPELALAERSPEGDWLVILEDDETFEDKFSLSQFAEKSVQGDLLAEGEALPKSTRVFGGYYLPWAANLEKRLTWSVAHTSCTPIYYCTHAFDFADGTMFPMVAAKGGTVFHWKDTCANGDTYCTNSITIQDRSTTPWTYQIYLHIAQGSVPAHLKSVGAPVLQGQYIADVDDTGYSSGHHVHFMVVTEDTRYMSWNGYVWGVAEDITFRDVDINWDPVTQGGRPRLAYEAETYGGEGRTYYVSGNQPAHPPTGGLSAPENKTYVTSNSLTVSGFGEDDIAVTKYEILAKYGTDWVSIHEVLTSSNTFTTSVDLCDTNIPNGHFRLGVRVWDYEGNPSAILSQRKLVKNVECSTAGTNPSVTIQRNGNILALPQTGFVKADAAKGSTGAAIVSVEFWFHGRNWVDNDWVFLGKDQNGSNGWQAPIDTTSRIEASNHTILAVVTDANGNRGVDVDFRAIVDHTPPTLQIQQISSPVSESQVRLIWSAGDDRSGIDYFTLGRNLNGGGFVLLDGAILRSVRAYSVPVSSEQIMVFELTAFDRSGNAAIERLSVYTEGYVFPNGTSFPLFPVNASD